MEKCGRSAIEGKNFYKKRAISRASVLLFDSTLKSFYKKKYYTSIIDRGNNVRVIREEFRDNSWSNNNPIIILTDRI